MQNKGLVLSFTIALILVCLFYLSFNVVTSHYDKQAKAFAQGNVLEEYRYLDSLSTEKVWLNYTLKECREKELNLGLDLKGGMNVIIEVSVPDILKTLAGNSTDETFTKAVQLARQRSATSQKDFIDLFDEAFQEIDKDARLAAIFSTYELKDKVNLKSTNAEVIAVIKEEVQATVDNSFNVLRTRIDRFGVVQPNIQRLETNGRILIELPGVKEPERVRKLLQGSANLEFWETYTLPEVYEPLMLANNVIKELKKEKAPAVDTTATVVATEEVKAQEETEKDDLTSLLTQLEQPKDSVSEDDSSKENPLFAILQLNVNNGQLVNTPAVGVAHQKDTAKVKEYLNLRQVKEVLPRDVAFKWTVKAIDTKGNFFELIAIKVTSRDGNAPLEGSAISDARSDFGQFSSNSVVSMTMNPEGARTWARLTKENIGRSIAIVLDDMVYSYPNVNTEITGGRSEISGNFTVEEAKDLANVLKSGRMPAPSRIVQEDVVGPSLGQEAIQKGMLSFIIAFIAVMLYMIFMYGLVPGLVVDGALLLNVFFLIGILASFKAVLTLPGIAGIVLTLGMAVDANVLIYERIKEELAAGKTHKSAIADGYRNALSAILDSNITTIITAIILFYFGTGPIKGFATTLIIGVITSFFTAVFVTRWAYEVLIDKDHTDKLSFATKLSANLFKNINIDWIKLRKTGYILSTVFMVVAIFSLAFHGLNQGIDFTGGRNYVVRFEQSVNTEDVQRILAPAFENASVSVITIGGAAENQVRISTNYKIEDNSDTVDDEIENILFETLNSNINNGTVTRDMFVSGYIVNEKGEAELSNLASVRTLGVQSSQKVGPAIADDIKNAAYLAVFFALIGIGLYILIRFKEISYSASIVVSLIHTSVFVLGVYSLFYSIMPFSMEIGQSFIAAILTVIGYSVNDTVVVFDRLRESIGLYPKRERREMYNYSVNATLARTFSTSFSTMLVLIVIFMLGGDPIRGFVFALLLGVTIGTYSTLFVSVPLAYDIQVKRLNKKK
jgi:SecD/SecF fusion protein